MERLLHLDRTLVTQRVSLPYVLPLAVALLLEDPMLDAYFHEGDLLLAVYGLPASAWLSSRTWPSSSPQPSSTFRPTPPPNSLGRQGVKGWGLWGVRGGGGGRGLGRLNMRMTTTVGGSHDVRRGMGRVQGRRAGRAAGRAAGRGEACSPAPPSAGARRGSGGRGFVHQREREPADRDRRAPARGAPRR
ncbi:contact-dependent growth inhibition system immunity protein [Streptomyces sp. NPDC048357]|uniref:contact-dependent growth inhibition system immunity protein n=1 Tax=Streptomyces sp. NPDC048357 TaxID=3154719 RepID=UPI00343D1265